MIKNFLASLISLTLFCFTIHYFSKSALSIEIDTGNILSNSTFVTGTTYSNDNLFNLCFNITRLGDK